MVACVLAILVESRYPSRQEFVALLILTLGVMLAVWQVRTSHALRNGSFTLCMTTCVLRPCRRAVCTDLRPRSCHTNTPGQ